MFRHTALNILSQNDSMKNTDIPISDPKKKTISEEFLLNGNNLSITIRGPKQLREAQKLLNDLSVEKKLAVKHLTFTIKIAEGLDAVLKNLNGYPSINTIEINECAIFHESHLEKLFAKNANITKLVVSSCGPTPFKRIFQIKYTDYYQNLEKLEIKDIQNCPSLLESITWVLHFVYLVNEKRKNNKLILSYNNTLNTIFKECQDIFNEYKYGIPLTQIICPLTYKIIYKNKTAKNNLNNSPSEEKENVDKSIDESCAFQTLDENQNNFDEFNFNLFPSDNNANNNINMESNFNLDIHDITSEDNINHHFNWIDIIGSNENDNSNHQYSFWKTMDNKPSSKRTGELISINPDEENSKKHQKINDNSNNKQNRNTP